MAGNCRQVGEGHALQKAHLQKGQGAGRVAGGGWGHTNGVPEPGRKAGVSCHRYNAVQAMGKQQPVGSNCKA